MVACRRDAVSARRRYYRARRKRNRDEEEIEEAHGAYRLARGALRDFIGRAKFRAWEELLSTLDEDPWERPYKIVLKKLRLRTPPTVEAISPSFGEDHRSAVSIRGRALPFSTGKRGLEKGVGHYGGGDEECRPEDGAPKSTGSCRHSK